MASYFPLDRDTSLMHSYKPFIDDPEHLVTLAGQRFVVLRPVGAVVDAYRRVQASLKSHLDGAPVSFPAEPHVTLAGFAAGTTVDSVRDLVTDWAQSVAPLDLAVARVSAFPPLFRVLIVEIMKTPALFHALASLREEGARRLLGNVTITPPEQWIFHMSLAYCGKLATDTAWEAARLFGESPAIGSGAQCTVDSAEIVAFDDGREHPGGIVALPAPHL
jgi:2'-5' RNA ligase